MKYLQRVLFTVFGLVLCAAIARADSINNLELSVNRLTACPTGASCFGWAPDSSAISFSLPNSGGTYKFYAVNIGTIPYSNLEITSLRLFLPMTGLNLTCSSSIFANCAVTNPYANTTLVSFSGGKIIPGQYFLLDFGCASGICSWPDGTNVTAVWGTNAPEPGSMALVLTGIGAILARWRLWRIRT